MHTLLLLLCMGFCPTPLERLEAVARLTPAQFGDYAVPPTDDRMKGEFIALKRLSEGYLGVVVEEVDLSHGGGPVGMATLSEGTRQILLDKNMGFTAKFETLGHEAGHWLQPWEIHAGGDAEVFAESVGYLVSRAAGHNSLAASGKYLAKHKASLRVLRDYAFEIHYAAFVLSGGRHKRR